MMKNNIRTILGVLLVVIIFYSVKSWLSVKSILNDAISKEDPSFCFKLKDKEMMYKCLTNVAISSGNVSICTKLPETDYEEKFYPIVGGARQIGVDSHRRYILTGKNRCFTGVAEATSNTSLCEYIKDQNEKENCMRKSENRRLM